MSRSVSLIPPVRSRLPDVGTTIFTVMTALASEHGAINLSQGFPDFDAPEALKAAVTAAVMSGRNQYPPMPGILPLREALAAKYHRIHQRVLDPVTEITVTPGATEALTSAILALVHPGDEVIVFDPAYDCYDPAIRLAGGIPVHIPLSPPDFHVPWDRVRDAITNRTAMIVTNTPHNPTGAIWSAEDIKELEAVTENTRIFVLADEVYEHLVYDGAKHMSVLASDSLFARSIAIYSFGKTFHVTGWKTGYAIGPAALMTELRKVHQFVTFAGVTPLQEGLARFMTAEPDFPASLPAFYQEKRDLFLDLMKDTPFRMRPSRGTYFQLASYSAPPDVHDADYVKTLCVRHGVGAIPLSSFYKEDPKLPLIRFCFAKRPETLKAAAERLSMEKLAAI